MRFGGFGRELGEWFGIQSPKKDKPTEKKTLPSPTERRGEVLQKGESLSDFASRAKEAYEKEGREFDYGKALLEAVGTRTKDQVVERHGEPWYKKIKNLFSERTDKGMLVQTCSLALLGATSAIGANYLSGELGYLAPVLFAFGGERYATSMIKAAMYLGEGWLKRSIDTARASLRKEIKQVFKKGSAADVQAGLESIKKRDIEFQKAKELQEKLEPWMKALEFSLPKAVMAAAVTGLIPNTLPIPVPLGFQDWDGRALPQEQFNAVYQNLRTGTLHFATDLTAGIGRFGNFITEHSDSLPKALADVFSTTPMKATYAMAAVGVGTGLMGAEIAKGAAAGVSAGARAFYNLTERLVASAKAGVQQLAEILQRPPTLKDVDTIRTKRKPPDTVRHIAARTKGGLQIKGSEMADALIAELSRRARAQEGETASVATLPEERAVPSIPAITGELAPQERLELPSVAQELREVSVPQTVWALSANEARARIMEAMGFAPPEAKQGVPYKQFKAQLRDFIERASTGPLEALQKFLQEKDDAHEHVLNGANTKDHKAILMWTDRQGLLKLIDLHLQELAQKEAVEPKQSAIVEQKSLQEPAVLYPGEPEPAFTLEDLLREAQEKQEKEGVKPDERPHGIQFVPRQAKDMLRMLLLRDVSPGSVEKVQKKTLELETMRGLEGRALRDLKALQIWDRRAIAGRLLQEIYNSTTTPHQYKENAYNKAWVAACRVDMHQKKILDDPIRVRIDDSKNFLYRGHKKLIAEDPAEIMFKGKLNIRLTPDSIKDLDDLIRAGAQFFYRIESPMSDLSAKSHHTSVTIFFAGPPTKELELISGIAELHGRETEDNLVGERVSPHFYLTNPFEGHIKHEHIQKFLDDLKKIDPDIAGVVANFLGNAKSMSGEKFDAIKKTLQAFEIPIRYHPERGVKFDDTQKSVAA